MGVSDPLTVSVLEIDMGVSDPLRVLLSVCVGNGLGGGGWGWGVRSSQNLTVNVCRKET